ncbi:hypothetical protein [Rhodoferax sp. WC2427]|uniref:hypothetical protein n=1 Tax=Rhodoferax sp. WC2427 TaxID=3234144 RepID=UPI0034661CDA
MNSDRRKRLSLLAERLTDVRSFLEDLRNEEEVALENMPESLQQGDRAQAMAERVGELDEALNQLDDVISCVEGCAA